VRVLVDVDLETPVEFIRTAYEPEDWIAVFLKSYATGRVAQRVGPVSLVMSTRFQAWLRRENDGLANVYVSVNAVRPGQLTRTRRAIRDIRHIFAEADHDGTQVVRTIDSRLDLPRPSYLLHSSPNRVHVFWRATGFALVRAESLQKRLARELRTDSAATPVSQMTRLPGFLNHKYHPPHLVTVEYRDADRLYTPSDFPRSPETEGPRIPVAESREARDAAGAVGRAERYLAALPPAITGQHGDLHTFRVCCRLVRGFALSDEEALNLLRHWNRRCEPPWSERELTDKLSRARRYGREPLGGLLQGHR
jgi:hypothetical protein